VTARTVALAVGAGVAVIASVVVWTTDRDGGQPSAASVTTAAGPALDGASLFRAKGCAGCHNGPDSAAAVSGPPDLQNASSWAGERVPGMPAEEYITQSIRDPIAVISPAYTPDGGPTTGMPTLALSDAEVEELVDYLLAP
jgi:cytochrome c1